MSKSISTNISSGIHSIHNSNSLNASSKVNLMKDMLTYCLISGVNDAEPKFSQEYRRNLMIEKLKYLCQ